MSREKDANNDMGAMARLFEMQQTLKHYLTTTDIMRRSGVIKQAIVNGDNAVVGIAAESEGYCAVEPLTLDNLDCVSNDMLSMYLDMPLRPLASINREKRAFLQGEHIPYIREDTFERKTVEEQFAQWRKCKKSKPLLITGAEGTGKYTEAVKYVSKYYLNVACFDARNTHWWTQKIFGPAQAVHKLDDAARNSLHGKLVEANVPFQQESVPEYDALYDDALFFACSVFSEALADVTTLAYNDTSACNNAIIIRHVEAFGDCLSLMLRICSAMACTVVLTMNYAEDILPYIVPASRREVYEMKMYTLAQDDVATACPRAAAGYSVIGGYPAVLTTYVNGGCGDDAIATGKVLLRELNYKLMMRLTQSAAVEAQVSVVTMQYLCRLACHALIQTIVQFNGDFQAMLNILNGYRSKSEVGALLEVKQSPSFVATVPQRLRWILLQMQILEYIQLARTEDKLRVVVMDQGLLNLWLDTEGVAQRDVVCQSNLQLRTGVVRGTYITQSMFVHDE